MERARILVVGDKGSGKTSLCNFLLQGKVPFEQPEPGELVIQVPVGEKTYPLTLQFVDTDGAPTARVARGPLYQKTEIVVICFSVVSRTSFENVPNWIKEVNEVKDQMEAQKKKSAPPLKLIVAGLKTDLMGVSGGLVKSAELIQFAQSNGALHVEMSAKGGDGKERLTAAILQHLDFSNRKEKEGCSLQ